MRKSLVSGVDLRLVVLQGSFSKVVFSNFQIRLLARLEQTKRVSDDPAWFLTWPSTTPHSSVAAIPPEQGNDSMQPHPGSPRPVSLSLGPDVMGLWCMAMPFLWENEGKVYVPIRGIPLR